MSPQGLASAAAPEENANGPRALRARLAESFKSQQEPAPPVKPGKFQLAARRGLKLAVGLAVALGLGWSPLRALFAPMSVEAVVNARLATIRAPIDGFVEAAPASASQWSRESEAPRLVIANPDERHEALTALKREVGANQDRIEINASERQAVRSALDAVQAQVARFRAARLQALGLRASSLDADAEAASARAGEVDAQWKRARTLRASGVTAPAQEQKAETEARASALAAKSAALAAQKAQAERDALAGGTFVGDDFNDVPASEQAARELTLKLATLDAEAGALARAKARLAEELATEQEDFARRSRSVVTLPIAGRVWETLTTRGERVVAGQDLLRVVDCESAIVSANVEETVYNRLRLGAQATFTPADGTPAVIGDIVNLTGTSPAPGVYAISPASLRKSPFYVSIALPPQRDACAVGRTGTVAFSKS